MMTKKEVLEFAAENRACSLATVEGNRPHVRKILLYQADENGIIFVTGRQKALHAQLQANPAVEMCFYNADENRQVRIEGTVEMLDDLELKKQVVEDFSFLRTWIEKEGYEVLIVYRLKDAKATTWTMDNNFDPKAYIQL